MSSLPRVAVVIPAYRVSAHIGEVISRIPPIASLILVVDDACPEGSGDLVRRTVHDPRVRVITHDTNQGVGGAVMTGYRAALAAGADIVVKVDGDGQMDPAHLPRLINPIASGLADYTKGNRFVDLGSIQPMPRVRLLGNLALSFMTKLSTGYWNLFDPTNGYTAIHRLALERLPLEKLARRYFFESDVLFRLGLIGAIALDVPMRAVYGTERSNLSAGRSVPHFLVRHFVNTMKRLVYIYYVKDFSAGSLQLTTGLFLVTFGVLFGGWHWLRGAQTGVPATAGTVMVAALPVVLGFQSLLGFLSFDVGRRDIRPLQSRELGVDLVNGGGPPDQTEGAGE